MTWRWSSDACFAVAELVVAIDLYARIDVSTGIMQFAERLDLLAYHAAVDGVSVLFILLTALLGVLLSFYGMARQQITPVQLLSVLLIIESSQMTMLTTMNLLWFAGASALQLALVGYLLWRWASAREENLALSRFLQYQLFGWCLFLAGSIVLVWSHADVLGGHWSFDLFDLLQTPQIGKYQSAAFYLLFYGLAIRTPLFPLHGWLPNSAGYGLIAVGPVLLLGVKVGIYGMARFLLPLTAEAVMIWQPYVVAFAMVGVFFAAVMAFRQANLRRLMAFAVVSHTSLIVIGLFTLHPAGLQGALLLAVNFGLAITVMLLMVGYVYRRTGTTNLDRLGGLFDRVPFIAVAFPDRRPVFARHAGNPRLRCRAPGARGVDRDLWRIADHCHRAWQRGRRRFPALGFPARLPRAATEGICRPRESPAPAAWSTLSAARRCWCCWPPVSTPSPG
jgi:NADH-quinone oxidoreductase subunit M